MGHDTLKTCKMTPVNSNWLFLHFTVLANEFVKPKLKAGLILGSKIRTRNLTFLSLTLVKKLVKEKCWYFIKSNSLNYFLRQFSCEWPMLPRKQLGRFTPTETYFLSLQMQHLSFDCKGAKNEDFLSSLRTTELLLLCTEKNKSEIF